MTQRVSGLAARAPRGAQDRTGGRQGAFQVEPLRSLMETASLEILAVTHWFEPEPRQAPYPVTIRFSGRRLDVQGSAQPGDHFVWDETIPEIVPGSGPVSVTARVRGVNPGEWAVTAHELDPSQPPPTRTARRRRHAERPASGTGALARARYPLLPRFWRRVTPHTARSMDDAEPVHTCPLPLTRAPGVVPMSWATLVALGMAVALATQSLLIARAQFDAGSILFVSLGAIMAGVVGAKGWYILKLRAERRADGWCIQGFVVGATAMALPLLWAAGAPATIVFDAMAPGLLFGMAIGRIGCFLAGCCGGPPTASRWGVWSSDQRVGARRVPTQFLESALALILGIIILAVIVRHPPASGAHFIVAVAAYTLGRQGVLRLRAEPSKTRWAIPMTALVSALILVVSVTIMTIV